MSNSCSPIDQQLCIFEGTLHRLLTLSVGRPDVADTPELFWSEASLFPLYEAIREYLEIGPRVQVLNDRLSVAGDLVSLRILITAGFRPVSCHRLLLLACTSYPGIQLLGGLEALLTLARNHPRIHRRARHPPDHMDHHLAYRGSVSG